MDHEIMMFHYHYYSPAFFGNKLLTVFRIQLIFDIYSNMTCFSCSVNKPMHALNTIKTVFNANAYIEKFQYHQLEFTIQRVQSLLINGSIHLCQKQCLVICYHLNVMTIFDYLVDITYLF